MTYRICLKGIVNKQFLFVLLTERKMLKGIDKSIKIKQNTCKNMGFMVKYMHG